MKKKIIIACHECDLLHRIESLPEGSTALCRRCHAVLLSHKKDSLNRSLALNITALILFFISNAYPLIEIKTEGICRATTLMGGVRNLYDQGFWEIALLVLFTAILFPGFEILSRLYLLLPLKFYKKPWHMSLIIKFIQKIKPWGMMDVFMLGILVSVIKLVKMVSVIPGPSLYSFFALIFVVTGAASAMDFHSIWEKA
ncbi:paraquat-inducible protein A [Desulfocicer vacuolatum DSM 3385]|uniref:Paraquat-inducible protein A n=1 Tax=Desulfocicer vacuolatum DSM 3385 TaxID=1121400 RepID=A0A1W2ELV2_9BACT|nr:paraquat-inducible protein A [Desulfocicer vacuolatum]SMD10276.1 paraquat-inducible protein A [Desulfocicer vacuolatum DSM 3385]